MFCKFCVSGVAFACVFVFAEFCVISEFFVFAEFCVLLFFLCSLCSLIVFGEFCVL